MGWIVALVLSGGVLAGLHLSGRLARPAVEIAVVAMLIALAGYGWQGSPDMAGNPVSQVPEAG